MPMGCLPDFIQQRDSGEGLYVWEAVGVVKNIPCAPSLDAGSVHIFP